MRVEAEINHLSFCITSKEFVGTFYETFFLTADEYEELVIPRLYEQANRWADMVLFNHKNGTI